MATNAIDPRTGRSVISQIGTILQSFLASVLLSLTGIFRFLTGASTASLKEEVGYTVWILLAFLVIPNPYSYHIGTFGIVLLNLAATKDTHFGKKALFFLRLSMLLTIIVEPFLQFTLKIPFSGLGLAVTVVIVLGTALKSHFGNKKSQSNVVPVNEVSRSNDKSQAAEPNTPVLLDYGAAVKVIKNKVVGAEQDWNRYRDALANTMVANYPTMKNVIEQVATQIQNWEGGSYDDLMKFLGIVEGISNPTKKDKTKSSRELVAEMLTDSVVDTVLSMVIDWPQNFTQQHIAERRNQLVSLVKRYADLANKDWQVIMMNFARPDVLKGFGWSSGLWQGLIALIEDEIRQLTAEKYQSNAIAEISVIPPTKVDQPATVTVIEDRPIWQNVLAKCDWPTSGGAKIAFSKAIITAVANELGWAPATEDEDFEKIWNWIEYESLFVNPISDRKDRDGRNNAIIEWLLSKAPLPA